MAGQDNTIPKSRFTHALHTNYVPSAEEVKDLQNLVVQPKERIRELEEEIARLQVERDELQQFVDSHCALSTPLRRLPADILGEIFVHCLPNNRHNLALCTVKEAPLLLTTICRTWREVALGTPRLWSSVHISVPNLLPTHGDSSHLQRIQAKMPQGIKLWLSRSGSRPLTLSIHMAEHASPIPPTYFVELMDVLTEYSVRWNILSLSPGVKALHQRSFERLTTDDLPLLKEVHAGNSNLFSHPHCNAQPPPQTTSLAPSPIADLVSNLPSLRVLHVKGSFATLGIPFDWARLTELHFVFQPLEMVHQTSMRVLLRTIVQQCHSLVTLTFRAYLSPGEINVADPIECDTDPIECAYLRELNIFLDGAVFDHRIGGGPFHEGPLPFSPTLQDICGGLTMPELLRLSVQIGDGLSQRSASDDILPFQSMVEGAPRLTYLWVGGYYILKPEALSQCLRSCQSLKTLVLHPERVSIPSRGHVFETDKPMSPAPNWLPEFLSSMNAFGSCPALETLDIGRCGQYDNLGSIFEFVQSESRISRLKDVKVDVGDLSGEQMRATADSVDAGPMQVVRSLREVHGISVDLKWSELQLLPQKCERHDPTVGLP